MKPAPDSKKDIMPEDPIEETETPEPSTSRKVTATIITVAVTLAMGIAASGLADKINTQIRKQITGV